MSSSIRIHSVLFICCALTASVALSGMASAKSKLKPKEQTSEKSKPKVNAYEQFTKGNRLASAGSYSRAIPYFERALRAAPDQYVVAHYNLGEIYRAKGRCPQALMHYQIFLRAPEQEASTIKLAKSAQRQCSALLADMPSIQVEIPQGEAVINLGGWSIPAVYLKDPIKVPKGDYTLEVSAKDHISQSRTVSLAQGDVKLEKFDLEKETFYGRVIVQTNVKDALVKMSPKELDKSSEQVGQIDVNALSKKGVVLPTGKYFLSVTHPKYNTWIRHVYVTRDSSSIVTVELSKALPKELLEQNRKFSEKKK